jgi:hypothetical protein
MVTIDLWFVWLLWVFVKFQYIIIHHLLIFIVIIMIVFYLLFLQNFICEYHSIKN